MFLNRKSKGVTLVELLVSLNIIAFGIFIMAIVKKRELFRNPSGMPDGVMRS